MEAGSLARCILVQGISSGSDERLLATALCRFLAQEGYSAALATPESAMGRLYAEHDWVVLEGTGSESNLEVADAALLLVADLTRGEGFADVIGTLERLEPRHRHRVAGVVLTGHSESDGPLAQGIAGFETLTGKRVIGVLPNLADLSGEEDTGGLTTATSGGEPSDLTVAVIRLPQIDNFADAAPLAAEPDVTVRYAQSPAELAGVDLVLLPGSKNRMADLRWLKERGLAEATVAHGRAKGATIGLCGGYQMLGTSLHVPGGLGDLPCSEEGLGLLPVVTTLAPGERITLTAAEGLTGLVGAWAKGGRLTGYEIHSGRTELSAGGRPAFHVVSRNGLAVDETDGCMDRGGWVFGTCLHGLFENDLFRRRLLNALRARRGMRPLEPATPADVVRERTSNRLAQVVRERLDLSALLGM